MTETALLEKLETPARTVERLENRVEDLEDQRHLESATSENADKELLKWDETKKLLELH